MQLAQCVAHSKCSRNIVIFIDFEKLFTKILEYDKIEEIFTFSNNFPQDIIKLMKINLKCFKPNPIIFFNFISYYSQSGSSSPYNVNTFSPALICFFISLFSIYHKCLVLSFPSVPPNNLLQNLFENSPSPMFS